MGAEVPSSGRYGEHRKKLFVGGKELGTHQNFPGADEQSWLADAILRNCVFRCGVWGCPTIRGYSSKPPSNIHSLLHYQRPWWKVGVSIMGIEHIMQCMSHREL